MPEVLLGEILGNQIAKNAIFHIKKSSFFYKTTEFAVSAWSIDQKTSENPQSLVKKRAKIQYFRKILTAMPSQSIFSAESLILTWNKYQTTQFSTRCHQDAAEFLDIFLFTYRNYFR